MKCLLSGTILLIIVAPWGCNGPDVEVSPEDAPVSPQPGFDEPDSVTPQPGFGEPPAAPPQGSDEQPGPRSGFDGATDPQSMLQDAPPSPTLDTGIFGDEDMSGEEAFVPEDQRPAIPEFSLQEEDEPDAE